ncbi:MAG: glucosaminidase domain-containing protein [Steroidobacteraceae bacterium]
MVDATLPASFYADFSGLTTLKKDVKGNDPQAIREAARQFESLFTDMMLKSMRAAKLGDGLGDSQQTDLYQDMYDQQLALQMSQGKGLGLADMLVQQLTRSGAIKAGAGAAAGAVHGSAQGNGAHGAVSHAARISFIRKLEPYAQRAAAQLGISSTSLIAQAALETGWGQHVPAGSAGSSHNLFGIKAGANWSGASVSARTTEYIGSSASDGGGSSSAATSVPQSFRAYSSLQQGVNDYVTLLKHSPGYQQALGTGDDAGAFASALQRGGYATDPDYVQKLVAMADTVRSLSAGAHAPLKLQAGVPTTSGGDPT